MRWSSLAAGLTTTIIAGGNVVTANPLFTHQTGMKFRDIEYSSSSSSGLGKRDVVAEGLNGWGTFDQLLDHSNPNLGTFKQRFWYGTEYWKGPGSPIFVVNAGEDNAYGANTTFTRNTSLSGRYAQENGGAVVIIEHRYWGESSPFELLTVENLTYLTLENSLQDMVYFAKKFVPPFDPSGHSSSENAPYVYVGGSYPGALAGWLATLLPGEGFWAYHGSSAVIETVGDFHNYFDPAFEYMPRNCSKDVTAVIDHVDSILLYGTAQEKLALKKRFGLESLVDEDFAYALAAGPFTFQDTDFSSGFNRLNIFCDFIEGVPPGSNSSRVPGANGVGVKKALDGYVRWVEWEQVGTCGYYEEWMGTLECLNSQNASSLMYTDLAVDNWANRQWQWFLCNEPFEWWQTTSPRPAPGSSNSYTSSNGLISRLVTAESYRSKCAKLFPPSNSSNVVGILQGKTFADVNNYTGGGWLNTKSPTKRLMHSNGGLDPWRDATFASKARPGGPLKSTPELPHFVIEGGLHCSDFWGANWEVNEGVAAVVEAECEIMRGWIGEFYESKGGRGKGNGYGDGNGNGTTGSDYETTAIAADKIGSKTSRKHVTGRPLSG